MKEKTLLEKALAIPVAGRGGAQFPLPEGIDDISIAYMAGRITSLQFNAVIGRGNKRLVNYCALFRGLRIAYRNGKLKIVNGKP